MFQGKTKAVTFSYDDGVTQDRRLVDMFNRYGLKATFNLNSGLLGAPGTVRIEGRPIAHNKVPAAQVRALYAGHEIAAHTLTHPMLTDLPDEEICRQVEQDRLALSKLAGYEVTGMAYPGGDPNYNDHVAGVIRAQTGVKYARTIRCCYHFSPQADLYRFQPSVYHMEWEKLFSLGEQFLKLDAETPQVLYVWGHSYEFDYENTWDKFEEFCRLISGRPDIFYGTNRQVFGL